MEPIPESLNKTITIRQAVGVAISIIMAVGASLIWVGSISSKVEAVEKDIEDTSIKLDRLIEDTSYIKGAVDEMRNKRGR